MTALPADALAAIYQPLDVDRHEIRVLDVQPGKGDNPVTCGMHVVALADTENNERPIYDALSYTWGSWSENRTIVLRLGSVSYDIPVTNNLHAALRNIRRSDYSMDLFVDAICINQHDNKEKSTQVARMGKVYESARTVRVWLGEPLTKIHHPFRYYSRIMWRYMKMMKCCRSSLRILHSWWDVKWLFYRVHSIEDALATAERQWYSRAWVVQEYCMAGLVDFHIGRTCIYHHITIGPIEPGLQSFANAVSLRHAFDLVESIESWGIHGDGHKKELLPIALATSHTSAENPRDKIYSLPGLLHEDHLDNITPDYSLPVWEVYARATMYSINQTRDLRHLYLGPPKANKGLPSWAVDFACMPKASPYIFSRLPTERQSKDFATLSADARYLSITGVNSAHVHAVYNFLVPAKGVNYVKRAQPFMQALWKQYSSLPIDQFRRSTGSENLNFEIEEQSSIEGLLAFCALDWRTACWSEDVSGTAGVFPSTFEIMVMEMLECDSSEEMALAVTSNGLFGMAPACTKVGDAVVYAVGSEQPLILRSHEGNWSFGGLAYFDNPCVPHSFDDKMELSPAVQQWLSTQKTERLNLV